MLPHYRVKYLCPRNCQSKANCHARLSCSKQLLKSDDKDNDKVLRVQG